MNIEKMGNNEIARYLREERNCAFILWQTDDVICKSEDMEMPITEKQVIDIMGMLNEYSDCEYGITWAHLENEIEAQTNYANRLTDES